MIIIVQMLINVSPAGSRARQLDEEEQELWRPRPSSDLFYYIILYSIRSMCIYRTLWYYVYSFLWYYIILYYFISPILIYYI